MRGGGERYNGKTGGGFSVDCVIVIYCEKRRDGWLVGVSSVGFQRWPFYLFLPFYFALPQDYLLVSCPGLISPGRTDSLT